MKPTEEIKCGMECIRTNASRICIKPKNGQCPRCEQLVSESLGRIQQLESQLAQVKRERDAAVRCLMEATKDGSVCTGCRHDLGIDGRCEEADFDCKQCKIPCMCKTCKKNSNYQWRGVCDDDTEDKK